MVRAKKTAGGHHARGDECSPPPASLEGLFQPIAPPQPDLLLGENYRASKQGYEEKKAPNEKLRTDRMGRKYSNFCPVCVFEQACPVDLFLPMQRLASLTVS